MKKLLPWFIAITVLATGLIGGWLLRSRVAGPEKAADGRPRAHQWSTGEQRLYALDMKAEIMSNDQALLAFTLKGEWAVAALRVGQESLFRAELRRVDWRVPTVTPADEKEMASYRDALGHPIFFTTDVRGALLATRVEKDPSLVQQVLKTIVADAQLVAAPDAGPDWATREIDTTGSYRAEYHLGGNRIDKKKIAYVDEPSLRSMTNAGAKTDVVTSVIHFELGSADGVEAEQFEERTRVVSSGPLPSLSSHTTLSLRSVATEVLADIDRMLDDAEKTSPAPPYELATSRAGQLKLDEIKSAGLSVPEILRQVGDLPVEKKENAARRARLFSALAAVIRTDDQAVRQIVSRLRAGDSNGEMLINALGTAGTPEAQKALVDLFHGATRDKAMRQGILISLSLVATPTAESLAFLSTKMDDPDHGRQAQFGVGSFANHLAGTNSELASTALGILLQRLSTPLDPESIGNALLALGNSGSPEALPMITPYLDSESEGIRAAAVRALRLIPGAEVDEYVATALMRDTSSAVRTNAMSAARDRSFSGALARAVDWAARKDGEAGIRYDAVALLIGWFKTLPFAAQTLEFVARTDVNMKVREEAQTALARMEENRP